MTGMHTQSASYYLQNKQHFVEVVRPLFEALQELLDTRGVSDPNQVMQTICERFESLLPDLPYIGGDENFLTHNLVTGAAMLCFYQVMKAKGWAVEDIGELAYRAVKAISPPRSDTPGEEHVRQMIASRREAALYTQTNPYPYGWQMTFLEGDGSDYDWGVDYTTCGVCRLYNEQGASEFLPYVCFLDLPAYRAHGLGLVRTTSLAQGGEKCDFRFNLRGEYRLEWTPGFYHPPASQDS